MKISGERDDADSPCVGVCSTSNLGDEVCIGCKRTFLEVIEWNQYSEEKKKEINQRLRAYHGNN